MNASCSPHQRALQKFLFPFPATLVMAVLFLASSPLPLYASAPSLDAAPVAMGQSLGWIIFLGLAATLPLVLLSMTSFVKLTVVFSVIRHALGTPQIPPAVVVTGLSLILTGWIMAPTAAQVWEAAGSDLQALARGDSFPSLEVLHSAAEPVRLFLDRHAHRSEREMFMELARIQAGPGAPLPAQDSLRILAPAFVISQLKEAFWVGFLVFLPFLIIDLVVANVLVGLGITSLSTVVIALPFKLLLFVVADGWSLITQGLVMGYL